jgi:outer membrane protein
MNSRRALASAAAPGARLPALLPALLSALLSAILSMTMAAPAGATDLVSAWRAALQHDLDYAAAAAAHNAGESRRGQAAALWRPSVVFSAAAGRAGSDSSVSGARFSAPGFGTSDGVAFDTSVNNGSLGRWSVAASLPLYNRERSAQGRQLELSADVAELEWRNAQQTLMLATAQRYFDVALAGESLRVLQLQQQAVASALVQAQDRFKLGDVPVTDTHEAAARHQAIVAQVLALDTDLQLKQAALADATGLPVARLAPMFPSNAAMAAEAQSLDAWTQEANVNNPLLLMQRAAVEVARQEAAKSNGAVSPSLDVVAQFGRERLSGQGDFGAASNASGNRMIGLQLTVPLYTGGMRGAREQEAVHGIAKAQAQADRAGQQVALQTRAAWLGLTVGAGRVEALAQAVTASRARLDATRLGRQVGDRTTLDLLNAENDSAGSELALLQARVGVLMDRLKLAALAGRLDEARLQSVSDSLQAPDAR